MKQMNAGRALSSASLPSLGAESGQSKIISRNALYSPIIAYEQTEVEPSSFLGNQQSVPKSLHESTLPTFLQGISEDYHRNRASGADPTNNGSRPLSLSDTEVRIRQRVVSMVGGGINSTIVSPKKQPSAERKPRKRPRREWDQAKHIHQNSNTTSTDSSSFLRELNLRWNNYISQVLGTKAGEAPEKVDFSSLKASLTSVRSAIDFTGAHVKIRSCSQRRSLIDASGIIVGESTNIWSIAVRSNRKGNRDRTVQKSDDKVYSNKEEVLGTKNYSLSPTNVSDTETVRVPKRGSSIDVIIPIASEDQRDKRNKAHESIEDSNIPGESSSIFVTITKASA